MLSPAVTFGLLIASLFGAVAHLLIGGSGRLLAFALMISCAGFAMGQAISEILVIRVALVGQLNVLTGSLSSFLGLVSMAFLIRPKSR